MKNLIMRKQIFGVVAGYAIFVVSSILLFRISGIKPHSDASWIFIILTFVYGTIFSGISGFVCQLISKTNNLKINYILSVIIAGFAAFSLLKSDGSSWTQLLAIFVFAPVSVLGGSILIKNK
jgi:hypothetical protein